MARMFTTDYWPHRDTMTRNHDWQATLDNYDRGDPIGYGPTEIDALSDLIEQLDDLEEEDPPRRRPMNIATAMRRVQGQLLGRPRYDVLRSRHSDKGRCEFLVQEEPSGRLIRTGDRATLFALLEGDKTLADLLFYDEIEVEEEFDVDD